ncbi:MAG: hypothetical protein IK083_05700 [Abditibacteriota bacterium]|nr:hypothetical protein [Abditibacteriota bacterium]
MRRFQDKDWTEAVRLSGAIDEKNKAIESGENELSAIAVSDDVDFDAIDNPKERLDALEVHVNGYKPSGHIDQAKERVMEALGQIPEPLRKYAEGMETIDDPRLSAMEQKTLAERESAVDKKVKGTLLKNLRSAKSGEADLPADGRSVWSYVGLIAVIAGIAAVCLGFVPLGIAMIIAGVVLLIVYPLSKDTKALAAYYERKRRDDVEKLELLIESDENKRELLLKDGSAEGESAMKEFYVLSAVLYNKALEEYRKLLEDRENLKGVILDGFAVFGKKPEEAEFEVCAKALQAGYNNWDKRRQLRHDIDTAASARAELESKLNAIYDKYGVESSEQLDQIKQVHLDYLGDCKTLEDKQKNCRKEYDKCSGDDPGSLDNARLSDEDAEWLGEAEKNEDINKRTSIEIENKIRDLKAHSTSKTLEEIDKQLTLLRDNKGKPKAVGAVKRLLVSRLQEYYSAKAEKLLEPASDLFRRITGDDTAEIALKDGRFLFRLEGVHKPFEALSGGARAQAILAYRLAHIQDGEGENKNPLIFDNALGECDDEKTRALCRAVLDIARSQGRQVFYFTCKKNEFEALKRCFEQNGAGELLQIYDRFGSRAG